MGREENRGGNKGRQRGGKEGERKRQSGRKSKCERTGEIEGNERDIGV